MTRVYIRHQLLSLSINILLNKINNNDYYDQVAVRVCFASHWIPSYLKSKTDLKHFKGVWGVCYRIKRLHLFSIFPIWAAKWSLKASRILFTPLYLTNVLRSTGWWRPRRGKLGVQVSVIKESRGKFQVLFCCKFVSCQLCNKSAILDTINIWLTSQFSWIVRVKCYNFATLQLIFEILPIFN